MIDKVYSIKNLRAAFDRVKANRGSAGVDLQTIAMFEARLERNLDHLSGTLRDGTYKPQQVKRVWIPKPGRKEKRPLGIPTVRDRVAQTALRSVLEPIFERDFARRSYGFRPGRGCKDALRRVDALLKQGYHFVVDADLKSYFDTIEHEHMMDRLRTKVSDSAILALVDAYLTQGILDSAQSWTPDRGTPQGAVVSPLLSNIYLDPLDHLMASSGFQMVRYADDFVILCRREADAVRALARVRQWTESVGLTLHPEKTRIVDAAVAGGFDFLGYHFERGYRWPRKKSLKQIKDTLRSLTKRTNGRSLRLTIWLVNRTLVGWFGYFQHSHYTTFGPLDKWLRMRLRSILRRRRGGRGRGRGNDHHRWPNAYFAELGLFSLSAAHALACQSSRR
ncbi:MAG: group II intron reverse transcriptase/maturase [Thermoanaerobaculia bacterium]